MNGRNLSFLNGYLGQVKVQDADVLMVCQIANEEILKIELMIHPSYFKEYMEDLKELQEKSILLAIHSMLGNGQNRDWNDFSR